MPAASDSMATRSSKGCAPDLSDLPPVTNLQHMSKKEMQAFIPKMVQCVTGKKNPGYGVQSARPEWWPEHMPWTDVNNNSKIDRQHFHLDGLRNIIRHCYLYHGRRDLLCLNPSGKLVKAPEVSLSIINGDGNNTQFSDPSIASASAYIPRAEDSPARNTRSNSISEDHNIKDKAFVEVFICFHCEKECCSKTELLNHQNVCELRPMSIQLQQQTPPRNALRNRNFPMLKPLKIVCIRESLKRPSKDKFLTGLGLVPREKAEELKKKKKNIVIDDKALEEPQTPRSPTTPRTPKSLLSQLSREPPDTPYTPSTPRWRRLSVCKGEQAADLESVSDASSDISEADERRDELTGLRSLLTIDVSSPLGKRVKRLVQPITDNTGSVVLDYNRFCHTPTKSSVMGKLRERNANFPITFKMSKRTHHKHFHMYTFSKSERRERYKRLVTGLGKSGRKLARSLPKSKVVLQRLTKEEIKKWTKPVRVPVLDLKPLSSTEIARWVKTPVKEVATPTKMAVPSPGVSSFPNTPVILGGDLRTLLGLKTIGLSPGERHLTAAQLLPEELNAEMSQQRLTVYRSLLSELHGRKDMPGNNSSSFDGNIQTLLSTASISSKEEGSLAVYMLDAKPRHKSRSRSRSPSKLPRNNLPTLDGLAARKSPLTVSTHEHVKVTRGLPNSIYKTHQSISSKTKQQDRVGINKDIECRTTNAHIPSVTPRSSRAHKATSTAEDSPRGSRRHRSSSVSSDSSCSSIILLEEVTPGGSQGNILEEVTPGGGNQGNILEEVTSGGGNQGNSVPLEQDQDFFSESDWSVELLSIASESSEKPESVIMSPGSENRVLNSETRLTEKPDSLMKSPGSDLNSETKFLHPRSLRSGSRQMTPSKQSSKESSSSQRNLVSNSSHLDSTPSQPQMNGAVEGLKDKNSTHLLQSLSKGTVEGKNVPPQNGITDNQCSIRSLRSKNRKDDCSQRGRKTSSSSSSSSCSEMSVDSEISFRISHQNKKTVMEGMELGRSPPSNNGVRITRHRQHRSLDAETAKFLEPLTIDLTSPNETQNGNQSNTAKTRKFAQITPTGGPFRDHTGRLTRKTSSKGDFSQITELTSEKNDDKDSGITVSSNNSSIKTRSYSHSPASSTGCTTGKRKVHDSSERDAKFQKLDHYRESSLGVDKPNFWDAVENWKCSLEASNPDNMCSEWVSSTGKTTRGSHSRGSSTGHNVRSSQSYPINSKSSRIRHGHVATIKSSPSTSSITQNLRSRSLDPAKMRYSNSNNNSSYNNNNNSEFVSLIIDGFPDKSSMESAVVLDDVVYID